MDSHVSQGSKNILVTGGAGFIGSHLVEELLKKDLNIVVPYIEIDPQSYFAQEKLGTKVVTEEMDITSVKHVEEIVAKHSIDFIYHLAAQTIVTTAYNDPLTTFNTNIMGTVNLLEVMRKNSSVTGMIFASSDKAYGKTTKEYTEDHPLKGDHPYDVSKSSADLIAQTYFKTYHTPVVVTRFGNVYGEGDLHLDRLIPGMCQAVIKNETFQIRSDGSYVRDYIYVKDVAKGYVLLWEKFNEVNGQAFNFSSSDTLSVIEVIDKAKKVLNVDISCNILNNAINEIPYQHLNDSKIRNLGWKPEYTLETALKDTLDWYKELAK